MLHDPAGQPLTDRDTKVVRCGLSLAACPGLQSGVRQRVAITTAGATASRAVFFSGIAVMIALSSLLIMPVSVFKSFGVGAILVVIAAVLAALTLLPAVLSLLGDRVNWLTIPSSAAAARRRALAASGAGSRAR